MRSCGERPVGNSSMVPDWKRPKPNVSLTEEMPSTAVSTSVTVSVKRMGKALTGVGVAGLAAFGFAAKGAMDFETGMREVSTLTDLSEQQFKDLSDQTLELSRTMGIDAIDATRGLYQAISAGVPRENVMEFLQVASQAAIAGVTRSVL